ncbi:MAG TPA: hypothetical protein VHZ55_03745 [Bryobacteraceae bacterium]|jgi:hypothetical protein|nr:hypothetical protein [Bryobacteraceae bacterium]
MRQLQKDLQTSFLAIALTLFCFSTKAADAPPERAISNGVISARLYLPNAESGYYRGARFDWSGVVSRLDYAGHNFFGVWFPHYEPTINDAITGPVEEFRSADGALGYGEAKPGGMFVKIGVGVLQKPDEKPYAFGRDYKILSTGKWVIRPSSDRVEFVQDLEGVNGYSYVYTKKVWMVKGKPELVLEHTLKNTGKREIDTEVYDHDFYVIDGQPTGPAFSVKFVFPPKVKDDLKDAAQVRGKDIVYLRELAARKDSAASYLEGYNDQPSDNDIRVENSKAGVGVEERGDHPISKLYLWSIRTTVCPEAYIALHIPPGKKGKWQIRYRFYKLGEESAAVKK